MSCVGVKTITISIEAYEALKKLKMPGESFSETILRLVRNVGDLMDLAGSWSDVSDEFFESFMKNMRDAWSSWKVVKEQY